MAKNEINQTRRDFLKAASIAGVAATVSTILPGCAATDNPTPSTGNEPASWDQKADVVVLGTGFAGLSAAIAAFDAGAKVLILEKEAVAYEGGNSRVSGQCYVAFKTVADGVAYVKGLLQRNVTDYTDAFYTTWVTEMNNNQVWVDGIVGTASSAFPIFAPEYPGMPGESSVQVYINGGAGNSVLWKPLRAAVAKRGIPVLNQTPASMLYYNGSGIVSGVKATDLSTTPNKTVNVKANKAVVIATGGFEFNQPMVNNFLAAPMVGMGSPANTGDGIKMAQELGADIIHMNLPGGPLWLGYVNKDMDPALPDCPHVLNYTGADSIMVDAHGKRFINEATPTFHGIGLNAFEYYEANATTKFYQYPRIPCWLVFGSTGQAAGAIVSTPYMMTWAGLMGSYTWSKDNTVEINKGWILKGADIPTLATKLANLNVSNNPNSVQDPNFAANLAAAITQWNTDAALATPLDSVFGRTDIKPVTGPYYAIQVTPGMINTQGGPRRNEKAQVMKPSGIPIPHLYSAGEMGAPWGGLYNGGGNISDCLAFGRVAGTTAVSETPV